MGSGPDPDRGPPISDLWLRLFPLSPSGCRTYSSRRKAGSVCLSLPAQVGTDRPPLMTARSVTSPIVFTCNVSNWVSVSDCSWSFNHVSNELLYVQMCSTDRGSIAVPAEHQDDRGDNYTQQYILKFDIIMSG